MERITFETEDGVTVVGDYREAPGAQKWALFLHMMPATRASWTTLADALLARGISSLAIDLRGHGESVRGPGDAPLDYQRFTDAEHQAATRDVEAAVRWMCGRGATFERLAVVGASIGANLAIVCAAAHGDIPAVVALSPGLDYRGIRTEGIASSLPRSQKLLLASCGEDEYSAQSCAALAVAKEDAERQTLSGAGHGTTMLDGEPAFAAYLVEWIDGNIR